MEFFKIDFDRYIHHQANYYNRNGEFIDLREQEFHNDRSAIRIPKNLTEMINAAEKLSEDFPFVRVDLYNIDGKIYFGELTFYPGSGYSGFIPDSADVTIGKYFENTKF